MHLFYNVFFIFNHKRFIIMWLCLLNVKNILHLGKNKIYALET